MYQDGLSVGRKQGGFHNTRHTAVTNFERSRPSIDDAPPAEFQRAPLDRLY